MDRFRNTRQPDWDWWGRLWPAPGETLRLLGIDSSESLAEVCSGNGYFALPAARIVAPAPVYAIDVDPEPLTELEAIAELQELDTLFSIEGDVRELSELLPEPVDAALIANTLHGVDDHGALIEEVVDALWEGGKLVIVNWMDRPREETTIDGEPRGPPTELRMSSQETIEVVTEAADLALTRRIELPPYHYGLTFQQ